MSTLMHRFVLGVRAGLVATIPMTLSMEVWFRRLPAGQQYPLPPSEIVGEVAERAGLNLPPRRSQHVLATLSAHFAYGGVTGALYALITPRFSRAAPIFGIAYGMGVWGGELPRTASGARCAQARNRASG